MPRTFRKFSEMKDMMKQYKGQTVAEVAEDMEVTERHIYECVKNGKIPYKGIMNWCIENEVSLDHILLKEKEDA